MLGHIFFLVLAGFFSRGRAALVLNHGHELEHEAERPPWFGRGFNSFLDLNERPVHACGAALLEPVLA